MMPGAGTYLVFRTACFSSEVRHQSKVYQNVFPAPLLFASWRETLITAASAAFPLSPGIAPRRRVKLYFSRLPCYGTLLHESRKSANFAPCF
jgi:hypothetical protein